MMRELKKLLSHLEGVLDPAIQNRVAGLFEKALNWQPVRRVPLVLTHPPGEDLPFEPFPFSNASRDPEKMLYNELVHAFGSSIAGRNLLDDDLPCTIRANFGTVIVASMFGAKVEQIGYDPPWVRPTGTTRAFEQVLACDPSDFSKGLGRRVVETYELYRQVLGELPVLQQCVRVVLPDLQGPLDTAEQLRGSAIYEDFYRNQHLLYDAMRHIAQAQVGLARHLQPYLSDGPPGYSHQHNAMIRGGILLRDDCAINISPAMYREQVAPQDAFVLEALGGGGIHCCGKCEHLVQEFLALPAVRCIDLGQPELNDIDTLYANARASKVALVRVRVPENELLTGGIMDRFPTGVTLVHHTESVEQARHIAQAYKKASEDRAAPGP
jgi:hypothetical protein